MLVIHVHIKVKEKHIEMFKTISMENAKKSMLEPGIVRFDILQNNEEPTRFVLNEIYRNLEATAAHKETLHYKKWRDEMENLMSEPRFSEKLTNIFPDDQGGW